MLQGISDDIPADCGTAESVELPMLSVKQCCIHHSSGGNVEQPSFRKLLAARFAHEKPFWVPQLRFFCFIVACRPWDDEPREGASIIAHFGRGSGSEDTAVAKAYGEECLEKYHQAQVIHYASANYASC